MLKSLIRNACLTVYSLFVIQLEHAHKSTLGNFNITHLAHALLTFLLFLQKLLLSGNITTITLGKDILSHGFDGLSCNNLAPHRCLNRNLKKVSRYLLF